MQSIVSVGDCAPVPDRAACHFLAGSLCCAHRFNGTHVSRDEPAITEVHNDGGRKAKDQKRLDLLYTQVKS